MLAALLALSGPALASGPAVWAALYNGRLIDAADRDHGAAIAVYETLLEDLGPEDPLRGQLLLSLGRAQRDAGRHEEAWWSLLAAAGQGQPAVRADLQSPLPALPGPWSLNRPAPRCSACRARASAIAARCSTVSTPAIRCRCSARRVACWTDSRARCSASAWALAT